MWTFYTDMKPAQTKFYLSFPLPHHSQYLAATTLSDYFNVFWLPPRKEHKALVFLCSGSTHLPPSGRTSFFMPGDTQCVCVPCFLYSFICDGLWADALSLEVIGGLLISKPDHQETAVQPCENGGDNRGPLCSCIDPESSELLACVG